MDWTDVWKGSIGAAVTGLFVVLAKKMDWIRWGKKDKAEVRKVESETALDFAEAKSKKISDDISISKASLEWTINLYAQLEKAHAMDEKRQAEIERLRGVIIELKEVIITLKDQIQKFEDELELARKECEIETQKNIAMKKQLDDYLSQNNEQKIFK